MNRNKNNTELWITKLWWDLFLKANWLWQHWIVNDIKLLNATYYLYCIWWYEQALIRLGHYVLFSFLFFFFFWPWKKKENKKKEVKRSKRFFLNNSFYFIYLSIYLLIYLFLLINFSYFMILTFCCFSSDIPRPPYSWLKCIDLTKILGDNEWFSHMNKTLQNDISFSLNDTHREKLVLYWIRYKNSLKNKVGCFWRFSYVYTIN